MKSKSFYSIKVSEILKSIEKEDVLFQSGRIQENWSENYNRIHLRTIAMLDNAGFSSFANELIKSSYLHVKLAERPKNLYSIAYESKGRGT